MAFLGLAAAVHLQAAETEARLLLRSGFSYELLDQTRSINRKQLLFRQALEEGILPERSLVVGASLTAIGDLQRSNTEAKFGYLMRHPTKNNQGGKSASELVLHEARLHFSGRLTSWTALHFQLLYNPEQSFGSGTMTSIERNQVSLRRGWFLFGNPEKSPFYASLGKMAVPFGLTETVNPFTASTVWHAFGGLAFGGLVGYQGESLGLRLMAIQGGAQFRAANSGDATPDDVANSAVDLSWRIPIEKGQLRLGASYMDGSAYNQPFPVTHFSSGDGYRNPAWDLNARLVVQGTTLIAEYAETTKEWPGTHNPHPPLNVYEASAVSSLGLGAKQAWMLSAGRRMALSAHYSEFIAGPEGSPWEKQSQAVLGCEFFWTKSFKGFAEVIRTRGYVPLNFISGPDPFDPTGDPGTTHSQADARSEVLLLGVCAAF